MTVMASLTLSAAARTRDLAFLQTLGLSARQALQLTVVEHGPPVLIALIPGVSWAWAWRSCSRPSLGLSAFAGTDRELGMTVDWGPILLMSAALLMVVAAAIGLSHLALAQGARSGRAPNRRRLMTNGGRMSDPITEIVDLPVDQLGGAIAAAPARMPSQRPRRLTGDEALIVCDNLVKIYKVADLEVVALQGLDLLVESGEFIALVGASGSGKSTLLNILAGLDVPSGGTRRRGGPHPGRDGAAGADGVPAQRDRLRLAADGAQPASLPLGDRERRAADDAPRPQQRRTAQPGQRAAAGWSAWPTAAAIGRIASPAASSSASPSPWHLPTTRP